MINKSQVSREERWLLEEKYDGVESADFFRDCERLRTGEPLAYVIGFVDFFGCRIDLSYRTLIPRPETEYWTEGVIKIIQGKMRNPLPASPFVRGRGDAHPLTPERSNDRRERLRVLDLFAGSGCIGIAIAKHIPEATVDFADIAPRALKQIPKNCQLNDLSPNRYSVIRSDIFSAIEGVYDIIVANPPYIPEGDARRLDPLVRDAEPAEALFGGSDGLQIIQELINKASAFMAPQGIFAMEFDDTQHKAIARIISEGKRLRPLFHHDQYGRMRWLTAAAL